jgi:hypothetical protein
VSNNDAPTFGETNPSLRLARGDRCSESHRTKPCKLRLRDPTVKNNRKQWTADLRAPATTTDCPTGEFEDLSRARAPQVSSGLFQRTHTNVSSGRARPDIGGGVAGVGRRG